MVQRPIEAKYRAQTEDLVKALEHTERWSLQRLSLGRFIIIIGNLMYAVGAFIADWNEARQITGRHFPFLAKVEN